MPAVCTGSYTSCLSRHQQTDCHGTRGKSIPSFDPVLRGRIRGIALGRRSTGKVSLDIPGQNVTQLTLDILYSGPRWTGRMGGDCGGSRRTPGQVLAVKA